MIRLIIIITCCLFALNMARICDIIYPINNDYYNNLWDKLKHIFYLILAGLSVSVAYFRPNEKYEKYVQFLIPIFVIGIILPMLIDKSNRFDPQKLWDFIFLAASIIVGYKKYKEKHV